MKNLVEFCAFSFLLVPLIEEGARGQGVPGEPGVEFSRRNPPIWADGSITPVKFEASINAALDADQFTYETKEQGRSTGRGVESWIEPRRGPPISSMAIPRPSGSPIRMTRWRIGGSRSTWDERSPTNKIRLHFFPTKKGPSPWGCSASSGRTALDRRKARISFFST